MDAEHRISIEGYIEMLREELIQEIQSMNVEPMMNDGASSFRQSFDAPRPDEWCCTPTTSTCVK